MQKHLSVAVVSLAAGLVAAGPLEVTVIVENISPAGGVLATPLWFGFHDGSFDLINPGEAASSAIERIAEDGSFMPLGAALTGANAGFRGGAVLGLGGAFAGPIESGESAQATTTIDTSSGLNTYFSYASMVIPSNDAFIANADALEHAVFDDQGRFRPFSFLVLGAEVWDAGTEVNDEIPANTAFFGQSQPNTGMDENGVVRLHDGFNAGGAILSDPRFANGDFTAAGFQFLRVTVVPAPGAGAMIGLAGLAALRRRR